MLKDFLPVVILAFAAAVVCRADGSVPKDAETAISASYKSFEEGYKAKDPNFKAKALSRNFEHDLLYGGTSTAESDGLGTTEFFKHVEAVKWYRTKVDRFVAVGSAVVARVTTDSQVVVQGQNGKTFQLHTIIKQADLWEEGAARDWKLKLTTDLSEQYSRVEENH